MLGMFKRLRIKNHKSHEDTVIEFHSGVNAFVGIGQAGKTNIIRAMQLLFSNRPRGGSYFSNFAGKKGETEVELDTVEGNKIHLIKNIRINKKGKKVVDWTQYRLNGEDAEFESGLEVPDKIREALNITELNIQEQIDSPFLITSSPGEVARAINRITKLENVDVWQKKLTQRVNSTNREIGIIENEIAEVEEELKVFGDFDETRDLIRDLEKVGLEKQNLINDKDRIKNFVIEIANIDYDIHYFEGLLEVEGKIEELEDLKVELDDMAYEYDLLCQFLDLSDDVTRLDRVVEDIEGYIDDLDEVTEEWRGVILEENLILSFIEIDKELDSLVGQENETKTSLSKLLKKEKKCPTCFREIGSRDIERIIKSL